MPCTSQSKFQIYISYRNHCSSNRLRVVHYTSRLYGHCGHWRSNLKRHSGRHKHWLASRDSSRHWLACWRLSDSSHESVVESTSFKPVCEGEYTVMDACTRMGGYACAYIRFITTMREFYHKLLIDSRTLVYPSLRQF